MNQSLRWQAERGPTKSESETTITGKPNGFPQIASPQYCTEREGDYNEYV